MNQNKQKQIKINPIASKVLTETTLFKKRLNKKQDEKIRKKFSKIPKDNCRIYNCPNKSTQEILVKYFVGEEEKNIPIKLCDSCANYIAMEQENGNKIKGIKYANKEFNIINNFFWTKELKVSENLPKEIKINE